MQTGKSGLYKGLYKNGCTNGPAMPLYLYRYHSKDCAVHSLKLSRNVRTPESP
jgi:hypothetical protein